MDLVESLDSHAQYIHIDYTSKLLGMFALDSHDRYNTERQTETERVRERKRAVHSQYTGIPK